MFWFYLICAVINVLYAVFASAYGIKRSSQVFLWALAAYQIFAFWAFGLGGLV